MSGTPQNAPARAPKSSPISNKQGPMKATIPISSVVKPNSLSKTKSPPISPTTSWKTRVSPDSPGQRSPGSSLYKVKSKRGDSGGIRRTASLDTLYLRGHWPRDGFYWHIGLQVDKGTQTDETDWSDTCKMQQIPETTDDKLEKILIRQRLQRSAKDSNGRHSSCSTSAIPGDHTLSITTQTTSTCLSSPTGNAHPISIPTKPLARPTIRSSIEGLNQEIEGLVLRSASSGGLRWTERSEDDKFCQVTPEGHRAPLADLFRHTRSRSVNTQTPSVGDVTGSCNSSGCPSRGSISPLICGNIDTSPSDTGGSQGSSPDQESSRLGTSPQINRFLAREPPDGCEKVYLKSGDERRSLTLEHAPQPCTFQLRPSLGSAFQILQPNLQSNSGDSQAPLPIVPQED